MSNSIFAGSLVGEGPQLHPHPPSATSRVGPINVRLSVLALVLAYCFYRYVQKQRQYRVW